MSFQPVIPLSGYTGWRFLQRTLETQQQAFAQSAPVARATDTFRERIGSIQTAADLVADRELLQVALGAFGLDDDIGNKYFIQKVLEDGTLEDDALPNRLADKRYAELSDAFGFGGLGFPRTGLSKFPDEIISRYEARQFERAVGEQDDTMRLALNLQQGLADIVSGSASDTAHWFGMMGNPPLRTVMEGALGMPSGFGSLDIDLQLKEFKSRADATFGSDKLADLTTPEAQEKLIRLYMIRAEAQSSSTSSGAIALTLLQSI